MKFSLAKLGCDHEEGMELDVLLKIADPRAEEAPAVCCPRCDRELLMPKDAYDQIKGGFRPLTGPLAIGGRDFCHLVCE